MKAHVLGPSQYESENASFYAREVPTLEARIHVDAGGKPWWRGASGMWHPIYVQQGDRIERD